MRIKIKTVVIGYAFLLQSFIGSQSVFAQHENHKKMMQMQSKGSYVHTSLPVSIPFVRLKNQLDQSIHLEEILNQEKPTLLQFIFTSCATVCPVMSATFGQVQEDIAAMTGDFQMVSISIDPEYDTPRKLAEYAKRFEAQEKWTFLTGSIQDTGKILRSFDVQYQSNNKMYHRPSTFVRIGPDQPWARFDGLLSADDLTLEFQKLVSGAALGQN
jgi:cytochrome oxidase Cu insertion factor (SCO1/SenC/PrrC family)